MNYYTINLEARVGDGTKMDVPYMIPELNVDFPAEYARSLAVRKHKRQGGPELTGVYTIRSPR